jgi:hypothetical protein
MKLLSNWRQAWRWWSVRVSTLAAALAAIALFLPEVVGAVWSQLPPELLARLPRGFVMIVPFALELLAIWMRVLQQRAPDEPGVDAKRSLLKSTTGKARPKLAAGLAAVVAAMLAGVIAREGGYVNHTADPGGETRYGITKAVAVKEGGYTGPMRTLPREVAESIYFDRYLIAPGYAPLIAIDAAVTEELFDTTVNMGQARPSRWFQQAIVASCSVKLAVDGRVGPGTIAAYRGCQLQLGAAKLCIATIDRLDVAQRDEYDRLARLNARLRVFHKGWVAHRIGNVDRRKCAVRAPA